MDAPFFHVGLVVADLPAAMADLGSAIGLTWARVQQRTTPVRTPSGTAAPEIRFTYSVQGPPHLELIEAGDVEPWTAAAVGGLHHVGLWVQDLDATAAALAATGSPEIVGGRGRHEGRFGFSYHRGPAGVLLELVDARSQPAFDRWLGGGDYA